MKKRENQKNNIENLKKILKIATIIFLSTSPIFDCIFFHSRITTLIRILIILIILITTIFLYQDSRKKVIWLILYYFICIIYLIINYYHNQNFISLFPNNFNYNFVSELFTILKLIMLVTLIFSLYYQKFNKKDYILIFKIWTLIITLSIIITNIFKISYSSYGEFLIKYNIFEWNKNIYYVNSASRAYFVYANQVALTLIILLIIFSYIFIKDNIKAIIYIFLISISMLMLGTRVSSLGGLLVFIFILISYIFFVIIKKEKFNKKSLLLIFIIIMWIAILPISPYQNRNIELNYYQNNEESYLNESNIDDNSINNNLTKQEYIELNANPNLIPDFFYKVYYSYEYDPDFWINFINNTEESKINYRYMEKSIIKRIIQINNNKYDILFGISNTRVQNVVNLEQDFLVQYYAFGIIGMIILLIVYPLILLYTLFKLFKEFNFNNFINILLIVIFIFCSYLTGNILNSMSMIIVFSVLSSYVLCLKE